VRWDELFDDLDAQFNEVETAELAAEVADRSRREIALLRLVDRLRPVLGRHITLRLEGAGNLDGQLTAMGPDWLLLSEVGGREALVASSAVLSIGGLAAQTAAPTRREPLLPGSTSRTRCAASCVIGRRLR
jgi:hypothetical protein